MPDITPRRRWVKLWTQETLYGTTTSELTPEQIGIWMLLLCMAGDSPEPGKICIAPNVGMTLEQRAAILKIPADTLEKTELELMKHNKISKNGTGIVEVVNFIKYQGFDKTIHNKIYMREYRKKNKDVSLTSGTYSNGYDSKEFDSKGNDGKQTDQIISNKDIEIRSEISLSDNPTDNVDSILLDNSINKDFTSKDGENSPNKIYEGFKEILLKSENPLPVLVSAMKQFHPNMPLEDKKDLYNRIGSLLKNKYHPANKILLLKDIAKSSFETIEGSHLDYLTRFRKSNDKELQDTQKGKQKKSKTLEDIVSAENV